MVTTLLPHHAFARAALLAAAALASCQAAAQPTPNPSAPPEQYSAVPVPAGQIDKAVASLDKLAEDTMHESGMPGMAIAVVEGDNTVYAKGFGVREEGKPAKVDADTVFQLASVSKPVGATVIAQQVGKKVIDWDTPVVKYLPWFALSDPWVTQHVTIGDLYAHRSGLPDHIGDSLEGFGFSTRQILERLRFVPLAPFRVTYDYTNFGITAAAHAVAAAAGKDWNDLSQEAIYGPLDMTSTSSRYSDFMRRADRASSHVKTAHGYKALYTMQPDAQTPAGGVSSSVNDMAKWMSMVLGHGKYQGKQIVSSRALSTAFTPKISTGKPNSMAARASFYGYGIGVSDQPSGRVQLSHSGAFETGAATTVLMIPSLKVGIVILSNAIPTGAVEALSMKFADLVQYGHITRDWRTAYSKALANLLAPSGSLAGQAAPAHPQPALKLDAYAGTYGNEYFGLVQITANNNGKLTLTVGPSKTSFTLTHWDGNRYVFPIGPPLASEGSRSAVDFGTDEAGLIQTMQVEFFNTDGMGQFTRR